MSTQIAKTVATVIAVGSRNPICFACSNKSANRRTASLYKLCIPTTLLEMKDSHPIPNYS